MEKPTGAFTDALTGETIVRELTAQEIENLGFTPSVVHDEDSQPD